MADSMTGGCACGRVRFTAEIADDEAYLCHCRMCQRATGSVSIAFKNLKQAEVRWDSGPDWYDSSPIATRPYCRGMRHVARLPVQGRPEHGPDGRRLRRPVALQARPAISAPRAIHRAWLNTRACPSTRTDEHQKLVDKWIAATGRVPE